jgi:hypothetical protein
VSGTVNVRSQTDCVLGGTMGHLEAAPVGEIQCRSDDGGVFGLFTIPFRLRWATRGGRLQKEELWQAAATLHGSAPPGQPIRTA